MATAETDDIEIEFLPGLGPFLLEELDEVFGASVTATRVGKASLRVALSDDRMARRLLSLRTAVAVHLVRTFAVPRPKALLGDEAFRELIDGLDEAMGWTSRSDFASFRINAAGRDSAVFQRLTDEIARATGLRTDEWFGDLLIRVRPGAGGWEVAARTTPRPLSARAWRRHNYRGALNATIAAAMVRCMGRGRYVNLLCGSGTLLAEYLAVHDDGPAVGLDIDPEMLVMARDNVPGADLVVGDARRAPLPSRTFAAITADLPYGQAVGSHAENEQLYADVLGEAARLAAAGAKLAVITHDIRRFRSVVARQSAWTVEREVQVFQKGHNPYIWLLRRAS